MSHDGRIELLPAMDIETSEAIDALRGDLRRVETTLDEKIDRVESSLRFEIREGLAENRRHFEVIAEGLRDDIRMIAEGVVALGAKVDALRPPGPPRVI